MKCPTIFGVKFKGPFCLSAMEQPTKAECEAFGLDHPATQAYKVTIKATGEKVESKAVLTGEYRKPKKDELYWSGGAYRARRNMDQPLFILKFQPFRKVLVPIEKVS